MTKPTIILLAIIILAACQFGDGITTWVALERGGHEANPVALGLMTLLGPALTVVLCKAVVIALCIALYLRRGQIERHVGRVAALFGITAFYLYAVIHNLSEL